MVLQYNLTHEFVVDTETHIQRNYGRTERLSQIGKIVCDTKH